MMVDTKRIGALLVAAAACAGLSAVAAEQSHTAINITGELQIDAVKRKGTTSFTTGQNHLAALAPGDVGNLSNQGTGRAADETDLIQNKVYLNFGFDLSANSKVFVQLGGRGLSGNNVAANTTNNMTNAGTAQAADSSFETRIRQAYVELHEVLVEQLGLRFGIQDVTLGLDRGDGNHFVMHSPGWGKHFQIRDGGRLENAFSLRRRQAQAVANPPTAASFDDVLVNEAGTFAWFVTFDQKDMFSAELFWVKLEETGNGIQNDSYLWGLDGKMPLKMINDKSVLTAHLFNVKDDSFFQQPLTAATKLGSGTNFWQYGLGADLFFQDMFEAYGEFSLQTGKFADNWNGIQQAVGSTGDQGQEKVQDAYAYYLGAKVMVPGAADFKPSLDVSYWSFSGDDDQNDKVNSGFINYGDNKSSLVVEENEYGIGFSNNYNVWRFKGSVDLGGLGNFTKGRKTPFTVSYHMFEVAEDRVRGREGNLTPANTHPNGDLNPGALGDEIDFSLAHDYSENVTFKLAYGIFRPGMYVRENANLSVSPITNSNGTAPVLGTPQLHAGDGATASVLVFTTSVKF